MDVSEFFSNYWLINLVADEFKELSKGLFICLTGKSTGKIEVDFSEVHTDWHGCYSLEKVAHKVKGETITFSCTGRFKLCRINGVDVKGDPVVSWVIETVTGEVLANSSSNFWYSVGLANIGLKNENILILDQLSLIFFIWSNSEVA